MDLKFWFLSLFAASVLVSQSAMDLFASLLCLVFLVQVFWRGQEKWQHKISLLGFEWIWPLWLLVVGLSYAFSPLEDTHALSRLLEFRWILLLYVVIWALRELRLQSWAQVPASCFLACCSLYAIVIWFLGFDPINPNNDMSPWSGGHRTGGFLSSAMTFAHIYGLAFCLFLGLTFYAIKWKSAYLKFLLPAVIFTAVGLVLSFTRGVWLAVGVAFLIMSFLYRPRVGALITVVGAGALAILLESWPALKERLTMALTSGDERQWIWAAHWKIFLDHPILGVGYGQNYQLIPETYKQLGAPDGVIVSHAHNQYLHWLAGAGVPGLLVYLIFLFLFLSLTWKTYFAFEHREPFKKGLALGCFGAQITFILGGLTEANFEHAKMKYAMVLVWGLVGWLAYEARVLQDRV